MTVSIFSKIISLLSWFSVNIRSFRLIIDRERSLGNFDATEIGFRIDINKEETSRQYVLSRSGSGMAFLDVGARDGQLTYLLGIRRNLEFDRIFI